MNKYIVHTALIALLSVGCGPKGDPGISVVGPQGDRGPAGIDITPLVVVQFCHGVTHYPDTFCEVGFRYGGKLYGTYSVNGGFSSYIPAGNYGSIGINCSCMFSVNNDGDVL